MVVVISGRASLQWGVNMLLDQITANHQRELNVALLERVAASSHFSRATRLRDFLLFVGHRSLSESSVPPHEQEIGVEVFGRDPHYDTGVDNIVRVNATEVRRRLQAYFAGEGATESIVLEMPRGGYTVVFRPREHAAPSEAEPERQEQTLEPALTAAAPSRHTGLLVALALCLLAAVAVCLYVAHENRVLRAQLQPWAQSPALRRFWSEFYGDDREVDIVVADATYALAQDIAGRKSNLAEYLNYTYLHPEAVAAFPALRREDFNYATNRNNGSIGDFIVAHQLLSLAPARTRTVLSFSREYTTEQIRSSSVILIGSRQSNPWVELYTDRLNFVMQYDAAQRRPYVVNQHPRPGEAQQYNAPEAAPRDQGYSVVAFVPNLAANGHALIIEGTDSQATRAGGEFVTNESLLEPFLRTIGGGTTVPSFEVLLRNTQLTGTPFRPEVVAYRVHGR